MWRKKKNREQQETPLQDKAAKGLAGFILKAQHAFASYFGGKTAGLQKKGKIIFLSLFLLIFGGLSVKSIILVFTTSGRIHSIVPDQIQVPKYNEESDETPENDELVTGDVYRKIQQFKNYMDSLKISDKGKPIYDSILQARPGLMDSVQMLEQLYYSQKQKQ